MKLLVDEQAPVQFAAVLRFLLPAHEVAHVNDLRWKSKKDGVLLADAAHRGFHVFVTNDADQLNDPSETRSIRLSRMHHVRYRVPGGGGMTAQGRALGALAAAMPLVVRELAAASSQRLVLVRGVSGSLADRCQIVDPQRSPPAYWR